MRPGGLKRIRLPDEFVRGALLPWRTNAARQSAVILANLMRESEKEPSPVDLLGRNKAWREIFKGLLMECFAPLSRYTDFMEIDQALDLFVDRVEAWGCMIGTVLGPQYDELTLKLKESMNSDEIRRDMTDQVFGELIGHFGPPRKYRTVSGLDRYYRRIREHLRSEKVALSLIQSAWQQSPWCSQQLEIIAQLLGERALYTEVTVREAS